MAINTARPVHENNLFSIRDFLAGIKSLLYGLKNSFSLNFLEEEMPGNRYFSHLIIYKLPMFLRKEIFRALGHTYPLLWEIIYTYSNERHIMELSKLKASSVESYKSKWGSRNTHKLKSPAISRKPATLENFNTVLSRISSDAVFATKMRILPIIVKNTPQLKRLDCCKVLELCTLCTDPCHLEVNCLGKKALLRPCWDCKSCCHSGAKCHSLDKSTLDTNTCYCDNNCGSNLLLPIMEVVLVYEGVEYRFNVLINSGSKCSYLADSLLDVLNFRANKLPTRGFVMKTVLGSVRKCLQEMKLLVKLPDCVCSYSFLVDKDMDLTFRVKELRNTAFNMQISGCKLAADFSSVPEDTVSVNGILGVDFLKYLAPMKLSHFRNSAAFELAQEFVPFGNIEDLLPVQKSRVDPQICGMNYSLVISQYSDYPVTHIYFVLEPKSKYLDPLDCFMESSLRKDCRKDFQFGD